MRFLFLITFFIVVAGCSGKVMEMDSPDGNYTIIVLERSIIDPPAQDIVLQDNNKGSSVIIKSLKEDWDWVENIKWRDDSKLAGVLVTRSFIFIIDPGKQGIIREIVLKEATNYPPVPQIIDFNFTGTNTVLYDIKTAEGNIQREESVFLQ